MNALFIVKAIVFKLEKKLQSISSEIPWHNLIKLLFITRALISPQNTHTLISLCHEEEKDLCFLISYSSAATANEDN